MKLVTKRKTLDLSKTAIMGILNVTPDSFSDGGEWFPNIKKATDRALQMIEEGADIIDIGGESTRPGSEKVALQEELHRVIPVIQALKENLAQSAIISIDTYKSAVASQAVAAGADMINDVSGLTLDGQMADIVGKTGVAVVINHMRGIPETMQQGEIVYTDVISQIKAFFEEKMQLLRKKNVSKDRIIIDPGFGFGKKPEHNITILQKLYEFSSFSLPVLIGISRKSTLGILLKEVFKKEFSPTERLEAGLAATAVAVMNGAQIIRTHDIAQTKKFLAVLDIIKTPSL